MALLRPQSPEPPDVYYNARLATGPGPRNAHGMVYHQRDSAIVLFGGASAGEVLGDIWCWKAGTWRRASLRGPHPRPRTFPAMAYDSARNEILLFAGNRVLFGDSASPPAVLGDTWVLRDGTWNPMAGAGPPARAEAAIAYDPRRRRTVLFGGYELAGGRANRLGDTWEWNGARWSRVSTTGPSPRSGAAMTYHPGLGAVVLFGGSGGPLGDTWSWNGGEWVPLPIPAAPGRFNPTMAWDSRIQRVVRFGGWDGRRRTSDTWELRENAWVQVESAGPAARNHAVLVSAPNRGSVMLHGGHDGDNVFGDLWERRNGRWLPLAPAPPVPRVPNGH